MMRKAARYLFTTLIITLVIGFPGITNVFARGAEEPVMKPVADEIIGSNGITWVPKMNYARLELTVSRPDGTVFSKTFDAGSSLYIDLSSIFFDGCAADGSYTYELRVSPSISEKIRRDDEPGLLKEKKSSRTRALTQSGHFLVQAGAIVTSGVSEGRGLDSSQDGLNRTQDLCYQDDMIIQYSLCVGVDCVCNMNFGFDTIVLMENNLRIFFDDTSTTALFPFNDWRIIANDSASGGASYFSIEDATAGRRTFSIEAGARSNALYVDDSGRVGLGTSTPAEDLHIWYGDTPTIRLHQSGSGWAPQTWDIAGNEANFFIRDVTNGSNLPFRIRPGAPTSSIDIANDGDVGIGTSSPVGSLDIARSNNAVIMFKSTAANGATGKFTARTDGKVFMGTSSDHPVIFVAGTAATEVMTLQIDGKVGFGVSAVAAANKLEVDNGARLTTGGTWTNASSIHFKENIHALTTDEALETLTGLNPVKFNYKTEKEEEYVGFIAEEVPALVATNDRKGLSPMDIAAVLTKVVQEQQKSIEEQKKIISDLNKRIAQLEKDSK
jgi:hypothetical protein